MKLKLYPQNGGALFQNEGHTLPALSRLQAKNANWAIKRLSIPGKKRKQSIYKLLPGSLYHMSGGNVHLSQMGCGTTLLIHGNMG